MKPILTAALGAAFAVAAALALPQPAAAQTDFLTVKKVACTPDSVTRCTAADKCETRPASARDKSELLVIDFATKKISVRKGGEVKDFGEVVEETVSGDVRSFGMTEAGKGGQGEKVGMRLTKAGKLTLLMGGNGNKAEATCAVES